VSDVSVKVIYKATNKVNGKVYIGCTVKQLCERVRNHKNSSLKGGKSYFHCAIRKYGIDNFCFDILDVCDDIDEMFALEHYYIDYFKSNKRKNGYNMTEGGLGNVGWIPSKSTRRKISNSMKGKLCGNKNPSKRDDVRLILKEKNLWNDASRIDEQKMLSLSMSQRMKNNNPMKKQDVRDKLSNIRSYEWIIEYPNKSFGYIKNLRKFCRENKLSYGNIWCEHNKIGKSKGFICMRYDDFINKIDYSCINLI
jgi:group I intron endonuclease